MSARKWRPPRTTTRLRRKSRRNRNCSWIRTAAFGSLGQVGKRQTTSRRGLSQRGYGRTDKNGYEDKFIDEVKRMKAGDRIAIKASFTRKNRLLAERSG